MTAWLIIAGGFALAMVLGVWLQHLAEMAKLRWENRGTEYDRGVDAGLEAAARLVEVDDNHRSGRAYAAKIRASRRAL